MGLPKFDGWKSLPLAPCQESLRQVGQTHLQVPWESFSGPKLKIYVKITYSEHFVFLENFWVVYDFWTLFSEKYPFLGNFDQNLFLPESSTHMNQK